MDVIFNCPKCEQELAVDSSGSGTQLDCPACGEAIVIPELEAASNRTGTGGAPPAAHPEAHPHTPGNPANPMSTSAASKVEMHLKVPSNKAAGILISKPLVPLDVVARESDKKVRVKTIKHTDCVEVGHDKFDEMVTNFLVKVGETNIINISTLAYTHLDIGSQKLMTDYGVLIVYKG